MVSKIYAAYNASFGTSLLKKLSIVMSHKYLLMKFETDKGITLIRGDI